MGAHRRHTPRISLWKMRPGVWLYRIHQIGHGLSAQAYPTKKVAALAGRQEANRIGFRLLVVEAQTLGRKDRGAPAWRKHTKPSMVQMLAGMGVRPVARPARRRWARR